MNSSVPAFKIVIPARLGSSRLPGKPLLPIAGRPMIVHVCERALAAGAEEVVVAVDDARIADAVATLPVTTMLTRAEHRSGTERLAEVAERLGWSNDDRVVNLQGDEPLIEPALVRELAAALVVGQASVATLASPIADCADIFNPNVVKVVVDNDGYAIYFSRAPIPWDRDGFTREPPELTASFRHLRHIGMYAYTAGFLRRYAGWPPSPLEAAESLEQLRILWHRERIVVVTVDQVPEAGVDTEADLRRVDQILASQSGRRGPVA